ncbi:cystatin-F [Synchiropus picturatus]
MLKKSAAALAALVLVFEVMAAEGSHRSRLTGCQTLGSPCNISLNDPDLQKFVLIAAQAFNNQTNDAFLFRPAAILSAQRQIVKGLHYIVDLELARTVCHKHVKKNLKQCRLQPAGALSQTLRCHADIWWIPWTHQLQTQIHCPT